MSCSFPWKRLNKKWGEKLGSTDFVIKDCKGDGNCQFRSIENAFVNAGIKVSHKRLRSLVANYIQQLDTQDFDFIITSYRLEKKHGNFSGGWDPFTTHTKQQLANEILKGGFYFQGDDVTLSLLSKALKTDFVILDDSYRILHYTQQHPNNLSNEYNTQQHPNNLSIILYYNRYNNSGHYRVVGLADASCKVTTLFRPSQLHPILNKPQTTQTKSKPKRTTTKSPRRTAKRSPKGSPKRKSKSKSIPKLKSKSPRKKTKSPKRKSKSTRKKTKSPKRKSKSTRKKTKSKSTRKKTKSKSTRKKTKSKSTRTAKRSPKGSPKRKSK